MILLSLLMYLITVFVIGLVLHISASSVGLSVDLFFDFTGLIIVLIPTFCLSFIGISNKESLFKNMRDNSIRFGWIGFIINLILMSFSFGMSGVSFNNIIAIFGLQFATACISLLYGYLFGYIIFEPLRKLNTSN